MSFDVSADAYLRFMGQYSEPLAVPFADLAGIGPGQRVLDVGCGPGALTAELVSRAAVVSAVEPSPSFAAAVRARLPAADVRQRAAEQLPFADDTFDVAMAQLVVHFMADPVLGLREMSRVTRPGGAVCACVWDHAGGRGPLAAFWSAVREIDPAADDESGLAGVREGDLASLFAEAGLGGAEVTTLGPSGPATRASSGGGSRSHSASARPGRTWPPCPRTAEGRRCVTNAGATCRPGRSRSARPHGPQPVTPEQPATPPPGPGSPSGSIPVGAGRAQAE